MDTQDGTAGDRFRLLDGVRIVLVERAAAADQRSPLALALSAVTPHGGRGERTAMRRPAEPFPRDSLALSVVLVFAFLQELQAYQSVCVAHSGLANVYIHTSMMIANGTQQATAQQTPTKLTMITACGSLFITAFIECT